MRLAHAKGMPARRIRCNVNASIIRHFLRLFDDVRLRNRQDAGEEHIPLPERGRRLFPGERSISDH
jgi:hypothetical protein